MYVLDSDHLAFLDRPESAEGQRLRSRMHTAAPEGVATTVVCYEEQTRGWLAYAAKARTMTQIVEAYNRLQQHLAIYRAIPVLGFDETAATHFQAFKLAKIKVGTMDLRIAAVALSHGATLVSRNLRDFQRVPGLKVEDWTSGA